MPTCCHWGLLRQFTDYLCCYLGLCTVPAGNFCNTINGTISAVLQPCNMLGREVAPQSASISLIHCRQFSQPSIITLRTGGRLSSCSDGSWEAGSCRAPIESSLRKSLPATLSALGATCKLVSCCSDCRSQVCRRGSLCAASCRFTVHCTLVVALTAAAAHALQTLAQVVRRVDRGTWCRMRSIAAFGSCGAGVPLGAWS
jgi:hypothetical protein